MKFFPYYIFLFTTLLLSLKSCQQNSTTIDAVFQSKWTVQQNTQSVWLGADYWSNPLQDWQLNKGRLECLSSRQNRNVQLLTHYLGTQKGDLQMTVSIGSLETEPLKTVNSAWAGVAIGVKGQYNDYRDDALKGKGIKMGITTTGQLFVDTLKAPDLLTNFSFEKGIQLQINAKVADSSHYDLMLKAYDLSTGNFLGEIKDYQVNGELLQGNIALVSDFPNRYNKKLKNTPKHPSFWFADWTIGGTKISSDPNRAFGPILFAQYTLSQKTLKLTTQLAPLPFQDNDKVLLQVPSQNEEWKTIAEAPIAALSRTATFVVKDWNNTQTTPYQLVYDAKIGQQSQSFSLKGTIQKEPTDKDKIKIAALSCAKDIGFPHQDVVKHVQAHQADLLFFAGDQLYEGSGGYDFTDWTADLEEATLDYLRKWYLFGWAFRDLTLHIPTVIIIDDHDVYQGNIWGDGGIQAPHSGSKANNEKEGGYVMPPKWVNMVQQTQTSHLPNPMDDRPVQQGIKNYTCELNYAGISFAILEDRKFKTPPSVLSARDHKKQRWDEPGARLLGKRQLDFLEKWVTHWQDDTHFKILLSQTIFANVLTYPQSGNRKETYPKDVYPKHQFMRDFDTNGWPQTPRNEALKILRKAFTFHIAGDQHLGMSLQYGIEKWQDAAYAFAAPSISNAYMRYWFPPQKGANYQEGQILYTGDFKDSFDNFVSVYAAYNPTQTGVAPAHLYDKATGYGIIELDKSTRKITMAVWARHTNPTQADALPCTGWPITIEQTNNYGGEVAWLPTLKIEGMKDPLIWVIDNVSQETVYTLRIAGQTFRPKVFNEGNYDIKVGKLGTPNIQTFKNIKATAKDVDKEILVKF